MMPPRVLAGQNPAGAIKRSNLAVFVRICMGLKQQRYLEAFLVCGSQFLEQFNHYSV